MFALTNEIRPYAWGSRTAMAEFLGVEAASPEPQAELWIGAYPGFPSGLVDGRSLRQLIAEDPQAALGADAVARFGPRLPFLMKVLTIGAPLSLQAHPDAVQAERGFAAEEAAGIPLDDPTRNYRDPRAKPEILCALSQVEAFCGFRAVPDSVDLLEQLAVPGLKGLRDGLTGGGPTEAVDWVLSLAEEAVSEVVGALSVAVAGTSPETGPGRVPDPGLRWISQLAEDHPRDRGVVLALLCDYIRLVPGQALVIPAGCLHGYLSGVGVEVMAESDNVLRGGLTAKHVDAAGLLRVLDVGVAPRVLAGQPDAHGWTRFPTGAEEFALSRLEVIDSVALEAGRPRLLLTVEGSARLQAPGGTMLDLPRGQAAFVAAVEQGIQLSGSATVYEATTGVRGDGTS